MKSINVQELKQKMDNQESITIIDVREQYEYDAGNINGIHIPLAQIPTRYKEIPTEGEVIIHCRAGGRSANAISFLQSQFGFENLFNLTGGMMAWKQEIDPAIDVA